MEKTVDETQQRHLVEQRGLARNLELYRSITLFLNTVVISLGSLGRWVVLQAPMLNHSDLQQTKRRKDDSDVHFASKPNECPLDKLIHLCIEDGIRKEKLAASDMAKQQQPTRAFALKIT